MQTKVCSNCKESLPATSEYFNIRVRAKDGLNPLCRVCRSMEKMLRTKLKGKRFIRVGGRRDLEQDKQCPICKNKFPRTLEFFDKDLSKDLGLRNECKDCRKKRKRQLYAQRPYQSPNSRLNCATWRKNHPQLHAAQSAKRRASRIQATPLWVDKQALKQIYVDCPTGYDVDHIVPLKGRKVPIQVLGETFIVTLHVPEVCGLHVPWNLQYLTPIENRKKSNNLWQAEFPQFFNRPQTTKRV
jgi:hypothetical protein